MTVARAFANATWLTAAGLGSLRDFTWRLAVFLLPWQVRWFAEGDRIGGLPWEQGRFSLYLSWLPMIAAVAFASLERRPVKRPDRLVLVGLGLILCASFFTISASSTVQWFLQFGLLITFAWALVRLSVSREALGTSFVLSLIPHAIWGIGGFAIQYVPGSTYLGMAFQHPQFPGVSVVQFDGMRLLRGYGGFPHPNIFGGWLAVAIPLSVWLADCVRERWAAFIVVLASALFAAALILTFSRSAWLGAMVGLLIAVIALIRQPSKQRYGWLALIAILMTGSLVSISQWEFIQTRTGSSERLEVKSIDERTQSLRDGWGIFRQHPLAGVGPGAELLRLPHPVTTHNVPLLILAETGMMGLFGLLLILWNVSRRSVSWIACILFAPIAIVALFDHYLWSLWAGRALMIITTSLIILPNEDTD